MKNIYGGLFCDRLHSRSFLHMHPKAFMEDCSMADFILEASHM